MQLAENPYDPPLETNDSVVETRPSVPWRQLVIVQLTLIIVVLLYLIRTMWSASFMRIPPVCFRHELITAEVPLHGPHETKR
jgi:hypothetical protein